VTRVAFLDVRPLDADIEDLEPIAGSVLELPFADRSLPSVSCLHVAEHIGLGRYGDPLDPAGTRKAIAELQRVTAPGGQLLFSLPVGRQRLCFNAPAGCGSWPRSAQWSCRAAGGRGSRPPLGSGQCARRQVGWRTPRCPGSRPGSAPNGTGGRLSTTA
jgi:SAM-dependent methyltransferase